MQPGPPAFDRRPADTPPAVSRNPSRGCPGSAEGPPRGSVPSWAGIGSGAVGSENHPNSTRIFTRGPSADGSPVSVPLELTPSRLCRWRRIARPSFLINMSPCARRSDLPATPPRSQGVRESRARGRPRRTTPAVVPPAGPGEPRGSDESGVTNPRGGGEIWPNICDILPPESDRKRRSSQRGWCQPSRSKTAFLLLGLGVASRKTPIRPRGSPSAPGGQVFLW